MTDITSFLAAAQLSFSLPEFPNGFGVFWLFATLMAYGFAYRLNMSLPPRPWTNPLLVSSLILGFAVLGRGDAIGIDIALEEFMQGGDWFMFLLGPAMVALALPLYDHLDKIKNLRTPFLTSLMVGSLCSAGSAIALGWCFSLPTTSLWALSTKSITSPMAIYVSQDLPSAPLLAGSLVVITGLFGSLIAQSLFGVLKVTDKAARGVAVGVVAHGIGASLLWRRDPEAAAFAALALVLNGLVTVFVLPTMALWLS